MRRYTPFLFLCFLLLWRPCIARDIRSCISKAMIDTDTAGLDRRLDFDAVPGARFFLLSELHNIDINPVLQFIYIRKLHRERALRYVILEMPHSYAFRYNLFLQTGADSLLGHPDSRHSTWLLQQLRSLNSGQPDSMQIRFIGIDLCIGNDASGYKTIAYHDCLRYFETALRQQAPGDGLIPLLHAACTAGSKKQIRNYNRKIAALLQQQLQHYRQLLKAGYRELLAVTSAYTDYRGSRDDELLAHFVLMLKLYDLNPAHTTFFASFGESHVNTADGKGMFASQLRDYYRSQQMPRGLCITGVQYFNTTTGKANSRTIENDGIVRAYGPYRKSNAALLTTLEACQAQLTHSLGIIPVADSCAGPYISHFNYLILCKHYTALNP